MTDAIRPERHGDSAERRPFGLPSQLRGVDWYVGAAVGLMPLAFVPFLLQPTSSLRVALLVAALPAGALVWSRLVRSGDFVSRVAAGFVGVSLVSAVLGDTPALSITGYVGGHASVLLYTLAMSVWALGRGLSEPGRRLLGGVLVAGMFVNILVGVAQIFLRVDTGPLATFAGRASGLLGNAAYYGSAVVALAAFAAVRSMTTESKSWWATAGSLAFGVGLSGSRGAVLALLIVVFVGLVLLRTKVSAVGAGLVLAGLAAASALTEATTQSSSVSRLDRGGDGRFQVWRLGIDAWMERPLFGWGLGNHGLAVRPLFTEDFVRRYAWEDYVISWNDPHNIVMLLLVSTGAVGVVFAATFVVAHVRLVDDWAFAAGFLATSMTWMLQPASVHSLPIAMVMLGASARRLRPSTSSQTNSPAGRVAIMLGVVMAGYVLVPHTLLRAAIRNTDSERAVQTASLLPPDPVVADAVANIVVHDALQGRAEVESAKEWSTRSADIQPGNPYWWAQHAGRMLELGEYDEVERAIEEGLAINGWSASAWTARLVYANELRDDEMATPAREMVCRLELPLCVTGPRAPDFSHVGLERSGSE